MLFAAGFGRRMGALTAHVPKPLIEVAGRPLIAHALAESRGQALERIVVNAHWHGEQIAAWAACHGLAVSDERDLLRDTGGGLKAASRLLCPGWRPGPSPAPAVFTMNTDAVWCGPPALATLADAWDPRSMAALLLVVHRRSARGRPAGMAGDFGLGADGRLRRGGPFIFTGAQIIILGEACAEPGDVFSLNAVWDRLSREGRLFGVEHPGLWCDVGHPAGIAAAEQMLAGAELRSPRPGEGSRRRDGSKGPACKGAAPEAGVRAPAGRAAGGGNGERGG